MKKKSIDWVPILEQLEKQVVEGKHDEVKNSISEFNLNHIPRNFVWPMAEMAWRISEPLLTLKLLNKIVFPENELAAAPTDREKFVYATALGNLGAVDEAIKIFESIDSQQEPEVSLRKSLAHFRVWNYPAAIPLLEKFLAEKNLSPYRKLIGKVNLAAALTIDCRYDAADSLLGEIQLECEQNNYLLLLGNCYELRAQSQLFRQNFELATSLLEKAIELLKNQSGEFFLYAEKWKSICDALSKKDLESLTALRALSKKALLLGQWETVRECDLFEAVVMQDEKLARKVILGTPFEYYRQRARRLFGKNILSQGNFYLEFGDSHSPFIFNPYEVQNGVEGLHTKPQLLALFEAITLDFYKPSHIGLLFQRIYKGEKFDPFSSPNRVLSLIKRLNQWFVDQNVPLRINMKKSEFGLSAHENKAVKILVQRAKTLSKQEGYLFSLRTHFKDRTFSSKNIAEKMKISITSAQSLIAQGIKEGHLVKHGRGRGISYALAPRNKKRLAA